MRLIDKGSSHTHVLILESVSTVKVTFITIGNTAASDNDH